MLSLFGGKKGKTPSELVKATVDLLQGKEPKVAPDKISEELTKYVTQIKLMLFGEEGQEPSPESLTQLANACYSSGLLLLLVQNLSSFEFEARKDTATIFNFLLRRQIGTRWPTVEHITNNEAILFSLVKGYEELDVAVNTGIMLRECIRHEALAKILLDSDFVYNFFDYVELSNFDVASDAFQTFKELLTKHKGVTATFLEKNYDRVFEKYGHLLRSQNYVTKRQSLKLLSELLLDRSNFNVMTRYISGVENLKLMMTMLKDPSKSIQFEAFHVFKVFVANPNKSPEIRSILLKNKEKLLSYLQAFHSEKDKDDEQFREEKTLLLGEIGKLQPL